MRGGIAFLALLALALLAFALGRRPHGPGGDAGIVREHLITRELTLNDPLAQAQQWLAIDALGARGARAAIELLNDASRAETASATSSTTVRDLAHEYLMHFASTTGVAPPDLAKQSAEGRSSGRNIEPDRWPELQRQWSAWVGKLDVAATGKPLVPAMSPSAALSAP
ncbi:MAG: hypothetical protein ACHREM_07260 [Polyangiales bacterium]